MNRDHDERCSLLASRPCNWALCMYASYLPATRSQITIAATHSMPSLAISSSSRSALNIRHTVTHRRVAWHSAARLTKSNGAMEKANMAANTISRRVRTAPCIHKIDFNTESAVPMTTLSIQLPRALMCYMRGIYDTQCGKLRAHSRVHKQLVGRRFSSRTTFRLAHRLCTKRVNEYGHGRTASAKRATVTSFQIYAMRTA